MELYQDTITLSTKERSHWIDITSEVSNHLKRSGFTDGVITVTSLHTTAAITINENGDPDVERDLFAKLNCLVPHGEAFYSHFEGNSDSHVKTSLIGISEQIHFRSSRMILGTWQSVYFCEFDGPRTGRTIQITIMGR